MLKRTKFYMLLTLIVITGLASGVYTKTLSGKERNFGVSQLKKSKEDLIKSVKNLNEAQLNFKADENSWSVKECVQHIALSETALWQWADATLKQPANPEKKSEIKVTDTELIKMATDRSNKFKAAETLQPVKAPWKNIDETLDTFKEERSKVIKYLKTTTDDVRDHVTQGLNGYVDAYQIILLISAHTTRHTKQIEEIKSHPNFPK